MPVRDRFGPAVAVGRAADLEETQRVAYRGAVFIIHVGRVLHDAGCCGQPYLDAVKMVERAPPLAVNAAVVFVDDDQVEIAGRVFFVLVHQRLQGDDGDTLFVLEAAAGSRDPIAGQMRQMLRESVLRLYRERVAIDHEQRTRRPVCFK